MTRTYQYGYGDLRLTEAELDKRWSWNQVHPEVRRRAMALMNASHDAGGDLGIGEGARNAAAQEAEFYRRHREVSSGGCCTYKGKRYQLRSGMAHLAPPGSSNHEDDIYEGYALAIDFVGWEDHWFDRNCERFGIKNFGGAVGDNVNGEEWHGQPLEFPNSRSAVNKAIAAGARLTVWALPGTQPQPVPPQPQPLPERTAMAERFEFTTPYRWDTRDYFGPLKPGKYLVTIPNAAGKIGVKGNLTIVPANSAGYATAWGKGTQPNASSLNWSLGTGPIANQIDVDLLPDGSFWVYIHGAASIVFDLKGFWQ